MKPILTLLLISVLCLSQESIAQEHDRGIWHLQTTHTGPVGEAHILRIGGNFVWVHLDDQNAANPRTYAKDFSIPDDQVLDHLDNAPINCAADVPASNGCVFIDYNQLSKLNDQTIHWMAKNHGGKCGYYLGIYTRDLGNHIENGPDNHWVEGKTFLVQVPQDVTSATVIGSFDGNAIMFSPKDPLSAEDAKRFKLLEKKNIPDDQHPIMTNYIYKVLEEH